MRALFLLVLVATAVAQGRDPDYDEVLAAYKAKEWKNLDVLAAKFLKEKPSYKFAHSVRFMRADSLFKRKRYEDAAAACREYLELHKATTLVRRTRKLLVRSLNELALWQEALDAGAEAYEKAVALEGLRRFEEAATELEALPYHAHVSFRLGVVRFRQRRFDLAKKHFLKSLEKWPESVYVKRAKDYLARIDPPYKRIEKGVVLDYDGKYRFDLRLKEVLAKLPKMRKAALAHIATFVGRKIPDTFLVRVADSGRDRSGLWAQVRTELVGGEARSVLVLRTEHLVLGTHDLEKTLIHELYHCVQRAELGEGLHLSTPKWVREGTALVVAGQELERSEALAAYVGSNGRIEDPLARLVNGLEGRHTLEDYAEDAAAFVAVGVRHGGPKQLLALLRRLLETNDVKGAIKEVLGEDFATFEKHTAAYARKLLGAMVHVGRKDLLEAKALLRAKKYEEALQKLTDAGVYATVSRYYRALALFRLGRHEEALLMVREPAIMRTTLASNAKLLELRILKAMGHKDFEEAARRARMDLTPFNVYPALLKFLDG